MYLAVRGMAQRSALKAKNDLLSAQIDRQKEHYAALTAQYANIRRMRHDIAKHLDTMQALLQSGQYQAAAAYSNEVSAQAQVQAHLGICENPIVDAYLFSRSQELERQGFRVQLRVLLPNGPPADCWCDRVHHQSYCRAACAFPSAAPTAALRASSSSPACRYKPAPP
ncbi:MAG: hypothetical protein ACLU3I_07045 [Acutalibacteraceae bacterium]